jgi:hypothetical protein
LLCQTTPADILALEPNVAHLLMQCLVEAKLSQMAWSKHRGGAE